MINNFSIPTKAGTFQWLGNYIFLSGIPSNKAEQATNTHGLQTHTERRGKEGVKKEGRKNQDLDYNLFKLDLKTRYQDYRKEESSQPIENSSIWQYKKINY